MLRSENRKVLAMGIIFLIFWPFIPVVLICWLCEAIRDAVRDWRRQYRKTCN